MQRIYFEGKILMDWGENLLKSLFKLGSNCKAPTKWQHCQQSRAVIKNCFWYNLCIGLSLPNHFQIKIWDDTSQPSIPGMLCVASTHCWMPEGRCAHWALLLSRGSQNIYDLVSSRIIACPLKSCGKKPSTFFPMFVKIYRIGKTISMTSKWDILVKEASYNSG